MQQSKVLGVFRAKCSKETVHFCFMESWGRSGRLPHCCLLSCPMPQKVCSQLRCCFVSSWLCTAPHTRAFLKIRPRKLRAGSAETGFDFIRTDVKVSFPCCAWCSILQNPVTLPDLSSSLRTLHLVPFTGDHLMSQVIT